MEAARQGPQEVVPDAYAEHVRALHALDDVQKMATLVMPVEHMQAVALVISDTLDALKTPLSPEHDRKWKSILRSLLGAIRDAE